MSNKYRVDLENIKIYRHSLTLTEEGLKEVTNEYSCKKTTGGYRVDVESNFGGKTTLVKKGEILKADSMLREMVCPLHFYTWFLEGQKEEAVSLVFNTILQRAHDNWRKAELLLNKIQ